MREFFRGWKRKLGVVTLLLASVFSAGWVRSWTELDCIGLGIGRSLLSVGSWDGNVNLDVIAPGQVLPFLLWGSTIRKQYSMIYPPKQFAELKLHITGLPQFGESRWFGQLSLGCTGGRKGILPVSLPYWSIVIPLAALSAWLLLSTPRAAVKPSTNAEGQST